MKKLTFFTLIGLLVTSGFSMDSKTLMHIISVPLIDGAGIYSSVKCLQTDNANNKAAAITNLSLLGINGAMGVMTMTSKSEMYSKFRTPHRIIGFLVTGASLWLTISAALDDDLSNVDKGVSAGYTALTVVPLVLFSF